MANDINNPLHIFIDSVSQKNIIEKKGTGIYQLKNRTGTFEVGIKEYEDAHNKLKKQYKNNAEKLKSETLLLEEKFKDVRWIYQLSLNNLP